MIAASPSAPSGMDERIWPPHQLNEIAKDFSLEKLRSNTSRFQSRATHFAGACRLYPSQFQRLRSRTPKALCKHLIKLVNKEKALPTSVSP